MSASKTNHWQQFRSSHLDAMRVDWRPPQHAPADATESAWLYGAGASAAVFIAVWYWQGLLGFPDLSAEIVRSQGHAWAPHTSRTSPTPLTQQVGRTRSHHAAADTFVQRAPGAQAATAVTRQPRALLPAAARRTPAPQPVASISAPGKPDMDLMDAPSSPLEQLALYSVRARQTANVAQTDSDPPSQVPGTLRINSRPWAHVFIDGRAVGNTPLRAFSISAGQHSVRLTNPDFGMAKSFNLHVEAGENITRIESLDD